MSSAPTSEEIARDATWLAQALDPVAGVARLIAMDRDAYRAASFLDDRMLQHPVDAQIVPWPEVEAAMAGDRRSDARWIFHIGHVGSTLVSRLLGEIDGVLAVREARVLRDLALSPPDVRARYLAAVPKLISRTFAPDGSCGCYAITRRRRSTSTPCTRAADICRPRYGRSSTSWRCGSSAIHRGGSPTQRARRRDANPRRGAASKRLRHLDLAAASAERAAGTERRAGGRQHDR